MPEKIDFERYKLTDVAVNDGTGGNPCWIIIKDSVYDVTNYLCDHPGGGELITEWAGRDATKGFDDFGHSGDAKKLLKQLKIGELVEVNFSVPWMVCLIESSFMYVRMWQGKRKVLNVSSAYDFGVIDVRNVRLKMLKFLQ